MLGRAVMVAPVLQQGTSQVEVYFPAATWYSLTDGARYHGPATQALTVPLTQAPPVFVRGGSIIAMQEAHNTTGAVRQSPVTLVAALGRGSNSAGSEGQGCRELQAALVQCAMHAAWAPTGTAGLAGRSSSSGGGGGKDGGLLLGCGSMFWDDGDSLEVPADGSVSMLFSYMAQANTQQGWIMLAAEGGDGYFGAADKGCACVGSHRGAGPTRVEQQVSHSSRSGADDLGKPAVQEVRVLGVASLPPGRSFAAVLDGEQLPAGQVEYDARAEVVRVTGLQLELGGVARLEWRLVDDAGAVQ